LLVVFISKTLMVEWACGRLGRPSHFGRGLVLGAALVALAACSGEGGDAPAAGQPLPNIAIADTLVFPESITSRADGTVLIGSVKGNVYKAEPGSDTATAWIETSPENGILTILGVLADEAQNTLWLCSDPNFFGPERSEGVASVMAFDLDSGDQTGVYPFPDGGLCNDIAVADDGTVYATDTPGGRILTLSPGADALEVWGQDDRLKGIDGLAFAEDGTLYVNNVQRNSFLRVARGADGKMGDLTELTSSVELGGPDGLRPIGGDRFLSAESTIGRLSIVTFSGDTADVQVLKDDLISSPGATLVGDTAYVLESNSAYLFNPDLKGKNPGPFIIYAVPINTDGQ
jgi:hypothetical protein